MRRCLLGLLLLLTASFASAADEGALKKMIETPHLMLTLSASDASIAPGRHITLILEVEPKPTIHLYAPGTRGYVPIDWQITPSPGLDAGPVSYPAARMLRLPFLHDTVGVYDSPVRLVRDVVVGPIPDAGSILTSSILTIKGTFHYQACNDQECYIPRTLSLRWTFHTEKP